MVPVVFLSIESNLSEDSNSVVALMCVCVFVCCLFAYCSQWCGGKAALIPSGGIRHFDIPTSGWSSPFHHSAPWIHLFLFREFEPHGL